MTARSRRWCAIRRLAKPDGELTGLLRRLASDRKNSVVITSGRDRRTLEAWLGEISRSVLSPSTARGCGCWVKSGNAPKRRRARGSQRFSRVLETFADRLPGSFVEEKEESLAWHYRMADPEQAELRAPELVDHLLNLTAKTDLQIVQGNKVVEVHRAGVDKGSAAVFGWASESMILFWPSATILPTRICSKRCRHQP